MLKSAPNQSGQALLIILLVMAVILTIALSVVSRSVTDISVSQKEESAARAYSAAEAGIERVLLGGADLGEGLPSGDTFDAKITGLGLAAGGKEYIVPLLMSSGETTPVWFVGHKDDGSTDCSATTPCFTGNEIKLCWGEDATPAGDPTTPAIEMSILYKTTDDNATARVARKAFDPNTTRNNSFTKGSDGPCIIEGKNFAFSKNVKFVQDFSPAITVRSQTTQFLGAQSARLRLLYNTDRAHGVGMMVLAPANAVFPKQGNKVSSEGESGESVRKIEVYQLYPDLPPVFDYGIFAGTGGITK